jgi:hypothetical protein
MNIFFLDHDIKKAAEYHVDKHVVKMRLELAQLACTAHHMLGTNPALIPYKKTHHNHPSALWVRESLSNYQYIIALGIALCDELKFRNNTQFQKLYGVFEWLKENEPNLEDKGLTRPKLAINWDLLPINEKPQDFIHEQSDFDWAIENYREYYKHGKQHLFSWKNREIPYWINK